MTRYRYRYSCVFIIQLTELTDLGINIEVRLFESDFKPPSPREPPGCVSCPALSDRLAGTAKGCDVPWGSGFKVPFVPSSLITLLEKAWVRLRLLDPNATKENFPWSVNWWPSWLKITLTLLIPSASHLCSQPFLAWFFDFLLVFKIFTVFYGPEKSLG